MNISPIHCGKTIVVRGVAAKSPVEVIQVTSVTPDGKFFALRWSAESEGPTPWRDLQWQNAAEFEVVEVLSAAVSPVYGLDAITKKPIDCAGV